MKSNLSIILIISFVIYGCTYNLGTNMEICYNHHLSYGDLPSCRSLMLNGRYIVRGYIFEVGYNDQIIIVKQHPNRDKYSCEKIDTTITNYFIVVMNHKASKDNVIGPLNKIEFDAVLRKKSIDIEFDIKFNVERETYGYIYNPLDVDK